MFIGNLQELNDVLLHPLIAAVLRDFVATNVDVLELPKGKTDLAVPAKFAPAVLPDNPLFMINSLDTSQLVTERRAEFHDTYLDIQLLLSGEEWIGIGPHTTELDRSDNPHPDLYFMDETPTSYVGLQPGDFVVIAPGELHTPLCTLTEPGQLRKIVFKVHKELLAPEA
ncbi:YhcH/YjgK/YiaL family protein [Tolumonas lignilytica]|uniref:YhcH/YjgK/YiaL family protein n=1 Tax=Tolumonas lignilytica TaxID=1283284 RepID=UPI0004652771|nr:YhcH/YjgK/YiaL family protein [Tolumonas lignilytica]